jgi:hypothetical protein
VTKIQKIKASNAKEDDNFGSSVAISGSYIVVGADKESSDNAGSAYLFKRISDSEIREIANLHDENASIDAHQGSGVAINGDYIVVGAEGEDKAYTYKRLSDEEDDVKLLDIFEEEDNSSFGSSAGIQGDFIIIGADMDDNNSENSGAVYLLKKDSNQEE